MQYVVQAKDVDLQVYEKGKRDSRILLVFLHGGPGSGAKPLMECRAFQALEERYHCLYFDQRGSGLSHYDLRRGLSREDLAQDVEAVIKDARQRWKPSFIALWGGSYGGALACLAQELCALDIDAMLLSNPAIYASRAQAMALFERMRKPMSQRLGLQDTSYENVTPEALMQNEHFVRFVHSSKNPSNSLRHIQAMSTWFFQQDYRTALSKIQVPCLVLNGKEDPICDCKAVIDAIKEIDNEWIYWNVLSPCGHAVFEDREEAFIETTCEYLQTLFCVL